MIDAGCKRCKGEGWVCENHREKAWGVECDCGPGKPCTCQSGDIAMPPGFVVIYDESGDHRH